MDSLHCPGCGAVVRAKESWCSLCYHDLRPAEPLVTAGQSPAGMIATNLLEPTVEPAGKSINIAGIPRPSSPAASESMDDATATHAARDDTDEADPAGEASKSWPCTCGTAVPLSLDACPTCGRAFLDELRGLDAPHRRGPEWLSTYLDASRPVRLAIAGMFAAAVAVGIPGLLALFS